MTESTNFNNWSNSNYGNDSNCIECDCCHNKFYVLDRWGLVISKSQFDGWSELGTRKEYTLCPKCRDKIIGIIENGGLL
jgi:hypothetical protein